MMSHDRLLLMVSALGLTMFLGACAGAGSSVAPQVERPPPGSNTVLRSSLSAAEGLEVIVSDVVIPPGGTVPAHYHPGEEFVYVLEGSAVQVEAGKVDRILQAGDGYVIPPEAVHAPRGGPNGARAVVFRVHVEGQPERIPAPEPGFQQP